MRVVRDDGDAAVRISQVDNLVAALKQRKVAKTRVDQLVVLIDQSSLALARLKLFEVNRGVRRMVCTAHLMVRVNDELVPNVISQVNLELDDDLWRVSEVGVVVPLNLQSIHVTIREVECVVADDALLR